jgi:hypothetical protein
MGRKRINADTMPGRFPAGTLDRVDAVLVLGETRADVLRLALERELVRRERGVARGRAQVTHGHAAPCDPR